MLTAIKNPAFQKSMIQNIALALCCVLLLSVFMVGNTSVAFCSAPTTTNPAQAITDGVIGLTNQIYVIMLVISCPIVAIMFGVAGFHVLGGGPQGIQKGKGTLFNACIGLVLIVFAPVFASAVANMLASNFTGDLNDYNPFAGITAK